MFNFFTNYSIRDKALGTMQLPVQNDESSRLCSHVFCYECLQQVQVHTETVIRCLLSETVIHCPLCNRHGAIVHHRKNRNPSCNWDNETESSTGSGNKHDECCPYPGVKYQKNVNMKDVRHMYTNNVTNSGSKTLL